MKSKLLCIACCGLAMATALDLEARSSGSRDAEYDCRDAMERRYDADGFHGVTVSHRRYSYQVTGYAERGRYDTGWFECEVDDGRIKDLDFDGWDDDDRYDYDRGRYDYDDYDDDDHHDSSKRKKIAAGIAAAAIIAAIASSKKSHSNDDDYDYSHHGDDDDKPATWNPESGVTCYKYSKQCLNSRNGSYNAYWTNREFH